MKKHIAVLLSVLLFIASIPGAVLAEAETEIGNDIAIKSASTEPSGPIESGKSFILDVVLGNKREDVKDIELHIEDYSSSFTIENGVPNTISVNDDFGTSDETTVQVPMRYNGGSSTTITLYVSYTIKDVSKKTVKKFVNISTTTPEPPIWEEPDTRVYAPELSVLNTSIPVANPGQTLKLNLTIVNHSLHYAKDVSISPVLGSGIPFEFGTINPSVHIGNIEGTKSKDVSFDLTVPASAAAGTYALQLKYKFSNLYGDKYEPEETIYIRVASSSSVPNIAVSKLDYPANGLLTGTTVPVTMTLQNNGSQTAKDIVVKIEGLETGGFTIEGNGSTAVVSSLFKGAEKQLTFNIRVAGSMPAGSHDLTARIEYKDESGNSYTHDTRFFLPVTSGDPEASGVQIDNLVVSDKTYAIDQNIPVRFNLINSGKTKVYNVKVSLSADQAIIPKTAAIKSFSVLEPGKSQALEFIFAATKEAITRNYPIAIEVEYQLSQDSEPIRLIQYAGVFVENSAKENEEPTKSVPKIIIDSYASDPGIVRAGQNFKLKISFFNTNSVKTIQNIKVFFTVNESTATSGNVFTPVNSSNTYYIDKIEPKKNVETELEFYTIPDAQPKTYTITANFEYEDGEGNPYTATELIGIPVVQQSRLETSTINMQTFSYLGQPIPLSFEFYNMGKVTLYNLMISVEGDFTNQNPSYFVGNFEPGYSDYYDTMITPNTTGQLTGAIVFAYDDAAGEHQEIRKEFTTTVEEMSGEVYNPGFPEPGFPGEIPTDIPGQETGIMKYVKNPIVWGAAGVIILGIAAVIVVKKIKKRKGMTLDE